MPNVAYWPSHRSTGTAVINIQSTLGTASICVKMFAAVLFGSKGTSSPHNVEMLVWPKKFKKGDNSESRVPRKSFGAP
jgi:hypothetical protein